MLNSLFPNSAMDAIFRTRTTTTTTTTADRAKINGGWSDVEDDDGEEEVGCCNLEAWKTLSKGFEEVQSVLDRNRRLIQQANENHKSLAPRNLAENVELIREINENVSKVIGLYSAISANFSTVVQQRRRRIQ